MAYAQIQRQEVDYQCGLVEPALLGDAATHVATEVAYMATAPLLVRPRRPPGRTRLTEEFGLPDAACHVSLCTRRARTHDVHAHVVHVHDVRRHSS